MDTARAQKLLAAERERITRSLNRISQENVREPPEDLDPGDRGSDLYEDELDDSLEDDLREQLAAVERAEERLATGTFGLSTLSGQPIPDERLEALPTAELTADEERAPHGS